MEEAGFVNVVEKRTQVAIGKWPKDEKQKELGAWNLLRIDTGLRDFAERRLKTVLNWENDEILVLVAKCRACIQDPKEGLFHYVLVFFRFVCFWICFCELILCRNNVYGQKPEKPSASEPTPA
jgi:hypothetical protein